MVLRAFFIGLAFLNLWSTACAATEILGHTYPIQEQDLLIWIKDKAQHWQSSDNWPHVQQQWQAQAQSKAERPRLVAGLSVTTAPSS